MLSRVDVVSTDVFNTLLFQDPGLDHKVLATISDEIPILMRFAGVTCSPAPNEVRSILEDIRIELKPQGHDSIDSPGPAQRDVYYAFFQRFAKGADPLRLTEHLLRIELDLHFRLTSPNREVLDFLSHARSNGVPVIALSDTYLSSDDLRFLLRRHKIEVVDRIYGSCEHAVDKFHGGLFTKVLSEEGLSPPRLLHIGDRLTSDVLSAREKGISAIPYRAKKPPKIVPPPADGDAAFQLGFRSFGPVFGVFSHLLLSEARRRGLNRLAFIARDGDLLRETTERVLSGAHWLGSPELQYVYLSRRSTALPAARRLSHEELRTALSIRAGGPVANRVLNYFGIPLDMVPSDILTRFECEDPSDGIMDPRFLRIVQSQVEAQTSLLSDYLRQERLFKSWSVALVDVGWRASIQSSLNRAFAENPEFNDLPGIYLGHWNDNEAAQSCGQASYGLLGDRTRGNNILESAPWHMAMVLESLCRASHGTVIGYLRQSNGHVTPVLAEQSGARKAERAGEALVTRVRAGIFAYVETYAKSLPINPTFHSFLRRKAQRHLLRLAFFPRKWEIEVLSSLVHTESHASEWHRPLVLPERPSPYFAPRKWLAGLSSPWRGAYVADTGGWPWSIAYFLAESLLATSPSLNSRVQNWARREAGIQRK